MAVVDLGACEWFVMELRRSGLIERGQLEHVIGEFIRKNPRSEPKALAEYLTQQNILSKFQAERILAGKAQGLVLGPYTLIDAIGSGSMGTVYKAVSKNDDQLYAVKVLPRRSMWNVRLARRQVRSFSQFAHPSVVPFVDVGTAGGLHFLAWPFVQGEPMDAVIERDGKLPADLAALFALQVAHGLSIAHQNGIFHGLLKPSNILLGSDQTARVLDFGIGSLLVENEGESLVDTMSTANTLTSGLDFSSPESIMEPTNRTPAGDQYSLGCILYYCLTGKYPFPDGSAVEKMMAHQAKEPAPIKDLNGDVPEGLVEIVARLMKKDPAQRYAVVDDVVEALQKYAAVPSHSHKDGTNGILTETPRPLGLGGANSRLSIPLRSGIAGRIAPRSPTSPPARGNLPPGVRMTQRPASEPSPAAAAAHREIPGGHPLPKNAANKPEASFGSMTLILGGMALMCIVYLGLTYFQVFK